VLQIGHGGEEVNGFVFADTNGRYKRR